AGMVACGRFTIRCAAPMPGEMTGRIHNAAASTVTETIAAAAIHRSHLDRVAGVAVTLAEVISSTSFTSAAECHRSAASLARQRWTTRFNCGGFMSEYGIVGFS